MEMICFRCQREINEGDNYYKMIEMNNKKEIKTDHVHRNCWDLFLNQITNVSEAKGMLRGLKNYLQRTGIIEPEEVIIK